MTYQKEYYRKHRDECLSQSNNWKKTNAASEKKRAEVNYAAHKQRLIDRSNLYIKKHYVDAASDIYVKHLILRGATKQTNIPVELLEAKRFHLKVKRLLKGTE